MHKSIVNRLRKIATQSFQPRWKAVVKDCDGLYRGDCGQGLTESQFDNWVKLQDIDVQIIIVEVTCNNPPGNEGETVNFKVENLADKNTSIFLRDYDELIEFSRSRQIERQTEIIAKSVEAQVSGVDVNCGCFTAEQARLIAEAQEIIRNAPIH
jgi:hypothetical protein